MYVLLAEMNKLHTHFYTRVFILSNLDTINLFIHSILFLDRS